MAYLDKHGLLTFLNQLKNTFGLKIKITAAREAIDTYILNIDYADLEFNTEFIVSGAATSATLGAATLGAMVLGSP